MATTPVSSLNFPDSFQVTPEWIEKTNDVFLLTKSLNVLSDKPMIKSLVNFKLKYLSDPSKNAQPTMAQTEKETGNTFMKSGSFSEAITHYVFSSIYNPKESTTYCNRALAHIKQNQFNKGISDCTTAIKLLKTYTKAYYRRALCYSSINRFKDAIDDLLYLINSGNSTPEIESELKTIIGNYKKAIGDKNWEKIEPGLNKEIENARQKLLETEDPNENKEMKEQYEQWVESAKKVKTDIGDCIFKNDFGRAGDIINICVAQCMKMREKFSDKTVWYGEISNSIIELNTMKIFVDYNAELKQKEEKNKKKNVMTGNVDKLYKTTILSKEQRDRATKIAEEDLKFSDFGDSAYGFERAFGSFKAKPDIFYSFMKFFKAENFQKNYTKSELPFPVLSGIINCFKGKESALKEEYETIYGYLVAISKTKGFQLVKNFIKKNDKEMIKTFIKKIGEIDSKLKPECDNLIKEY